MDYLTTGQNMSYYIHHLLTINNWFIDYGLMEGEGWQALDGK